MPVSPAKAEQDQREIANPPPQYASPSDKPYSPKEPVEPQQQQDDAQSQAPVQFGEPSEIVSVGVLPPSPLFLSLRRVDSGAHKPYRPGQIYTSPIRQRHQAQCKIHRYLRRRHQLRRVSRRHPWPSRLAHHQQQMALISQVSSISSNLLQLFHSNRSRSRSRSCMRPSRQRINLNSSICLTLKRQLISSAVQCTSTPHNSRSLHLIYTRSWLLLMEAQTEIRQPLPSSNHSNLRHPAWLLCLRNYPSHNNSSSSSNNISPLDNHKNSYP